MKHLHRNLAFNRSVSACCALFWRWPHGGSGGGSSLRPPVSPPQEPRTTSRTAPSRGTSPSRCAWSWTSTACRASPSGSPSPWCASTCSPPTSCWSTCWSPCSGRCRGAGGAGGGAAEARPGGAHAAASGDRLVVWRGRGLQGTRLKIPRGRIGCAVCLFDTEDPPLSRLLGRSDSTFSIRRAAPPERVVSGWWQLQCGWPRPRGSPLLSYGAHWSGFWGLKDSAFA